MMTIARPMSFWSCAWIVVLALVGSASPAVDGSDRGRSAKCPSDVRDETRLCLTDYTGQLDALLLSDNRFFPGLDVEVIRSLCSLLDDSMRCIQSLVESCPRGEQHAIEGELGPHLGVRQLCVHPNIYEEYAMNQNCFVRIRPEAENCNRNFMIAVQDDEPIEQPSSSSSSLSSSQRHQTPQQRQYCNNVKRLISCVKNIVRSNSGSCQKMALKLVDVLVRASLPTTVSCREEPNATSPPAQGKTSDRFYEDGRSSGDALRGSLGPFSLWCCVLAALVCLQPFYVHLLEHSALLLFHRRPSDATPLPPPPPAAPRRRRLQHRNQDLLLS